jgi:hypothetical protein
MPIMPPEPELSQVDPFTGEQVSFVAADYAALWGCDPVSDKSPCHHGDGYLFYNYAVEGDDPAFLEKFIPAIERTREAEDARKGERGYDEWAENMDNLAALKDHCEKKLAVLRSSK